MTHPTVPSQFLVFRAAVKGEGGGQSAANPGIELPSGRDRSILYIGLEDTVGALTSAMERFKAHGINMGCINRWVPGTGLDWIGLDWIGLDWIGWDWIGLDWIGWDGIGWDEVGSTHAKLQPPQHPKPRHPRSLPLLHRGRRAPARQGDARSRTRAAKQ